MVASSSTSAPRTGVKPVFNGNPHAPSTAWLESIAGPGGYEDAEDGDEGTDVFQRDGDVYEVTVRKNPDDEQDA